MFDLSPCQCEFDGYQKLTINCEPINFQYFVEGNNSGDDRLHAKYSDFCIKMFYNLILV